jgi:hypothetical protein
MQYKSDRLLDFSLVYMRVQTTKERPDERVVAVRIITGLESRSVLHVRQLHAPRFLRGTAVPRKAESWG